MCWQLRSTSTTTLRRIAEVVRTVIDYEIFAILLLNEKTQELRFRFQLGYPPDLADGARIKVGEGVTGKAAQLKQAVLVDDVTLDPAYISAVPNVRSELAVPLITKNRVIGVMDLEARNPGYFNEEHSRLLTLVASRIAGGIENAQLYTRIKRQARILVLLNEFARELSSILNLDELLNRVAELLAPPHRLPDVQHSFAGCCRGEAAASFFAALPREYSSQARGPAGLRRRRLCRAKQTGRCWFRTSPKIRVTFRPTRKPAPNWPYLSFTKTK